MEIQSLVSVILPTYNRAELIDRAINSVIIQTYPNWELIVWDDGSTDHTAELVRARKDKRLKYFRGDNHGVAYARNRAIEQSKGKYIAFLDSDDEWMENKLDIQTQFLDDYPQVDILFSNFLNIDQSRTTAQRTFEQYASAMKLLTSRKVGDSFFVIEAGMPGALAFENFIATDTVILRRELLKKTGCFNEALRNGEDFELWWRIGLTDASYAYLNQVCMTRYKLANNLSGSSIIACEHTIKGLDICLQETIAAGREDLLPCLRIAYRNIWQNMITLYADRGNTREMLNAFFQSLKYGFRLGAIRLLVEFILKAR